MKKFDIERPVNADTLLDTLANDAGDPNNRLRRIRLWATHHATPAAAPEPAVEEVEPAEAPEEE